MAIDINSNSGISINDTTLISISNTNGVSTPRQPAFHIKCGHAAAVNTDVIADTPVFDIRSNYNNTNGRFTAPVAGVYHFMWHQLISYSTTGRHDVYISVNDVLYTGSQTINHKETANTFRTMRTESIIKLNANDYVKIHYNGGTVALNNDNAYGAFSGYMVG